MLKNTSKNTIVSDNYSFYKNSINKTKGLLFTVKPKTIIFKTRFGIHTFFMKYNIDLLILDKKKQVVVLKKSIKPNRIVFWNPKFDLVIELPSGSINKSKTEKGDILNFNL